MALETNKIIYLSGQNLPVSVPISTATSITGISHFIASFPFESAARFTNRLTIAALVNCTGKTFMTNDKVAAATLYRPGLIEIN